MPNKEKYVTASTIIFAAAGVASIIYIFSRYRQNLRTIQSLVGFSKTYASREVLIVNSKEECEKAVRQLKSHCSKYPVLGFDCEWLTVNGSRHSVALLQLASREGLCALVRLCKLKCIPGSLREILEDPSILKVGVAPIDDARYLMHDYAVNVKSTLDLRYLTKLANMKPEGLAALSKTFINVELDKNWRIRCSDWEADTLTDQQIDYAAKDAQVAVHIFQKLESRLRPTTASNWFRSKSANDEWAATYGRCRSFTDMKFKNAAVNKLIGLSDGRTFHTLLSKQQQESMILPSALKKGTVSRKYSIATRTKPLYHNCFLQAPDGELLCTCDTKKAAWYIEKGIGEMVIEDPFTVRLKFEPAGRSVGDVGKFYQTVKENKCVVCGKSQSYIRKNVVPREYRKLFPAIMKDHSSHDVLLLCINCHQLSNLADQNLRMNLANMCSAPIIDKVDPKYVEDAEMKKVRSAARALINMNAGKCQLPPERVKVLEDVIVAHFIYHYEITDELLKEAANVQVIFENEKHESHGEKVVEYFTKSPGGLLSLEQMWRMHFLESMAPKYLPSLWSVDHNKSRLTIRLEEGRINLEDAALAGL